MSTRAAVTEEGSSVSIAVTGGFNCAFISRSPAASTAPSSWLKASYAGMTDLHDVGRPHTSINATGYQACPSERRRIPRRSGYRMCGRNRNYTPTDHRPECHGKRSPDCIQRRRHRRHHHDHGARTEGAAGDRPRCAPRPGSDFPELRSQLCLRGDLLEQPPSPTAHGRSGQRAPPVGEQSPAVLDLAGPVRHRLDG
jgi:hypothetical protein